MQIPVLSLCLTTSSCFTMSFLCVLHSGICHYEPLNLFPLSTGHTEHTHGSLMNFGCKTPTLLPWTLGYLQYWLTGFWTHQGGFQMYLMTPKFKKIVGKSMGNQHTLQNILGCRDPACSWGHRDFPIPVEGK